VAFFTRYAVGKVSMAAPGMIKNRVESYNKASLNLVILSDNKGYNRKEGVSIQIKSEI